MPIYEYACRICRHEFESIQKISEPPLVDCPECGEPELKKKISAVAFRLKGSGWYETDFKSGDKKNLHGEQGKSEDSSNSSDTAKSESKSSDTSGANARPNASKTASSNGGAGGAKASEQKS